jgi:hypothetical protein
MIINVTEKIFQQLKGPEGFFYYIEHEDIVEMLLARESHFIRAVHVKEEDDISEDGNVINNYMLWKDEHITKQGGVQVQDIQYQKVSLQVV